MFARGDHISRRLTEFPQLFVGHSPEPRSQAISVQGCYVNGLHYCLSIGVDTRGHRRG
jgi:hypothetical protein